MFIAILYIFNIFIGYIRIILSGRFITFNIHNLRPTLKGRIHDTIFFHTAIIHFVRKFRTTINHIFLQIIMSIGPNVCISSALPHLETAYLGNLSHIERYTPTRGRVIPISNTMETVCVIITLPDISYRQTTHSLTITRQTCRKFFKFRLVKFLFIQRIAFQLQHLGIIIPTVTNSVS